MGSLWAGWSRGRLWILLRCFSYRLEELKCRVTVDLKMQKLICWYFLNVYNCVLVLQLIVLYEECWLACTTSNHQRMSTSLPVRPRIDCQEPHITCVLRNRAIVPNFRLWCTPRIHRCFSLQQLIKTSLHGGEKSKTCLGESFPSKNFKPIHLTCSPRQLLIH